MIFEEKADYKNPLLPAEERVEDLLGQMTLEEKVAQTVSIDTNALHIEEDELDVVVRTGKLQNEALIEILKQGIGSFQLPGKSLNAEKSAIYRNMLQKHIRENTRLQIPVLSQEECLMGHLSKGATMFPRPIGLAGSFDTAW